MAKDKVSVTIDQAVLAFMDHELPLAVLTLQSGCDVLRLPDTLEFPVDAANEEKSCTPTNRVVASRMASSSSGNG